MIAGGAKAGAHLVAHPGVDRVVFTGSTQTGRAICETRGRLLRPVAIELGGKSAAIVLDDADLDATMQGLRTASFANAGQICYQNSRILAPWSRYTEVVDALATLADDLNVGKPLDPATEIGPLVSVRQREHVLDYINIGRANGARLVTGGGIPKDQPRGWFVSPTVFADVDNTDRIAREEIFGPVLPSSPTTSKPRRSTSPTTASSASEARCGRPTLIVPPRWPAAKLPPAQSESTVTGSTSPRRSAE